MSDHGDNSGISKGAGQVSKRAKRSFGSAVFNLYVWSTQEEFVELRALVTRVSDRYGWNEARNALRTAILDQRADAPRVIAALNREFAHMEASPITDEGAKMLATIFDD